MSPSEVVAHGFMGVAVVAATMIVPVLLFLMFKISKVGFVFTLVFIYFLGVIVTDSWSLNSLGGVL